MSFHYRKEVISPEVLQELYSLTPEQKAQKEIRDAQIRAIITGESDKFLLIIGPCSADHEFIQTNQELPARVTKESFTSLIRKKHLTLWRA